MCRRSGVLDGGAGQYAERILEEISPISKILFTNKSKSADEHVIVILCQNKNIGKEQTGYEFQE